MRRGLGRLNVNIDANRAGRAKYLHCELPESLLNLAIRCALGHAQYVVVVDLNHRANPCPAFGTLALLSSSIPQSLRLEYYAQAKYLTAYD